MDAWIVLYPILLIRISGVSHEGALIPFCPQLAVHTVDSVHRMLASMVMIAGYDFSQRPFNAVQKSYSDLRNSGMAGYWMTTTSYTFLSFRRL